MRAIQGLFLAAILVVLSIIAVDLHRLVATLQPDSPTLLALFGPGIPANETREQRNQRMKRQIDELAQDVFAGASGITKPSPKPLHQTEKPTR